MTYIDYKRIEQSVIHSNCKDIDHYRDLYNKLNNIYNELGNVQRYVHKTPNEVMAHHLYDMVFCYDNEDTDKEIIINNIKDYFKEFGKYVDKCEFDRIISVCVEIIKCIELKDFFEKNYETKTGYYFEKL